MTLTFVDVWTFLIQFHWRFCTYERYSLRVPGECPGVVSPIRYLYQSNALSKCASSVLKRYFSALYICLLTSTVLAGKLHNACLNMVLWAQFITDFNEIEPSQISYRDYHVKLTEYDTSAMKTFILWYSCHSLLFETSLNSLAVIQRWLYFLSIDWVLCWLVLWWPMNQANNASTLARHSWLVSFVCTETSMKLN